MELKSSWPIQGYFDVANYPIMPAIKDILATALDRPLHVKSFPVGPSFRRVYWWREGDEDYVEAQFFMQISGTYPVLSIGISVEKGLEQTGAAGAKYPVMNRATWDWQRVIDRSGEIFSGDLRTLANALPYPLSIRTRARRWHNGARLEAHNRTFVFDQGRCVEHHVGGASIEIISAHVRELDQKQDVWVNLYFACDLSPLDVGGMTDEAAAGLLLKFNGIRERLRPSPRP